MPIKDQLLQACQAWLQQRNAGILQAIAAVAESMDQEGKSSAGDKHNTGRAMLQLEREKLGEQQDRLKTLAIQLQRIDPKVTGKMVAMGSIVTTTNAVYFLSIPAGKIEIEGNSIYAIGSSAPIAKLLMGKQQGDSFNWNGITNTIQTVN